MDRLGRLGAGLLFLVAGTPLAFGVLYFASQSLRVMVGAEPSTLLAAALAITAMVSVVTLASIAAAGAFVRLFRPVAVLIVSTVSKVKPGRLFRKRLYVDLEVRVSVHEGDKQLFDIPIEILQLQLVRKEEDARARELVRVIVERVEQERVNIAAQLTSHIVQSKIDSRALRRALLLDLGQMPEPDDDEGNDRR